MERDGVVTRTGKQPGTTRPSYVFELTPESRRFLSKAYLPMLTELVAELEASLPAAELHSILRRTGKRLAHGLAAGRRPPGDLRARVTKASELMNTRLGTHTHVERNGHHYVNGMAALPEAEQQAFLQAHPDLYEHSHGATRLRIRAGRIALASLDGAGFASAAMPDWNTMPALQGAASTHRS